MRSGQVAKRSSRIHSGTRQKGGQIRSYERATVRGTNTTLAVTFAPGDLDVVETISTLNKVIMPKTRELQRLGIVHNTVEAESVDSRPLCPATWSQRLARVM